MLELTLALLGVVFSAFFSSSELAYISANPLQLEVWRKQRRRGSAQALRLLNDPDGFLITVLVGTTISNIFATSFATIYLIGQGWHPAAVLLVITIVILFFGEILPKSVSVEQPNRHLRLVAPLHILGRWLLLPVIAPLRKLSDWFLPGEEASNEPHKPQRPEREDLKILFTSPKEAGVIQKSEQELITQVFEFGETSVSRAMTPRIDIVALPEQEGLDGVIQALIESGNSKLPVYRDSLDNIVGVVYLYDLFKDPPDLPSIIKPVVMVPDSNTTADVLKELQRAQRSIAIVLDEFGGTAGLVTLEDLFEELFGEFEDEFDVLGSEASRLPDGSILAQGKAKVEELNRRFGLGLPAGDYETIAGYLTATLGRIPYMGEWIYLPSGVYIIKKSTPRRIEQLQIRPGSDAGSAR